MLWPSHILWQAFIGLSVLLDGVKFRLTPLSNEKASYYDKLCGFTMNQFKDDQNYEQKWIKEIEGHPALSHEQFAKKKAQVLATNYVQAPVNGLKDVEEFIKTLAKGCHKQWVEHRHISLDVATDNTEIASSHVSTPEKPADSMPKAALPACPLPVGMPDTPECDVMLLKTAKYLKKKIVEIGHDSKLLQTNPKVHRMMNVYHAFKQTTLELDDGWTMIFCPNFCNTHVKCEQVFFWQKVHDRRVLCENCTTKNTIQLGMRHDDSNHISLSMTMFLHQAHLQFRFFWKKS